MNIAMLGLRSIGGQTSGGVERHVEELAVRMVAQGHKVTVFCRGRYNSLEEYKGVRLVNRPAVYSKHLEAITHTLAIMPSVLAGFDVVHIHATGPSLFSWLPRLFGRKVVVTVHGLDFLRAKWGGLASLVLRCGAWTAAHCPNETIVVSRTLRAHYLKKDGIKTRWIPNGVSAPVSRRLDKLKRFGLEPGGYLLSLGRLVPEKGLHYLIQAFAGLDTPLKLVIAGGGLLDSGYERELHKLAAPDPRVIFTGPLYGEDKDEAFSNARFFVLPSDLEGMPIAMLEAMSYGCPMLTSDISECTEISLAAEEEGSPDICSTFAAGNIESLAAKLSDFLVNPELKALGERGRQYILARYSWDDITAQTLAVYMDAAG